MAATLIDPLLKKTDELEAELAATQAESAKNALPEKYRGKSVEDVVKMHQEAESALGRQGAELGELRKLSDQYIRKTLDGDKAATVKAAEDKAAQQVDFFADPQAAIKRAVAESPEVKDLQNAAEQTRRRSAQAALLHRHPDAAQVGANPDFQKWVMVSPIRQRLFEQADKGFDFDAAEELIGTFKALTGIAPTKTEDKAAAKAETSRGATTPKGTVPTEISGDGKKIYRRADIIRLHQTDRARYEALQPELLAAYAEGRVR